MKKAPIAFFAYNRPEHTLRSLESLTQNEGAAQSELFIFCDGSKRPEDRVAVSQVREIVRSQQWCGQVHITERQENRGLAKSIISGVTEICACYGRVIVLEDDLILSPYFLNFMNDALEKYENESSVMHISGYMFPVEAELPDTFFIRNASCWGWATWQRAWQYFEQDSAYLLKTIEQRGLKKEFSLDSSYSSLEMLNLQNKGELDSWAIRWYATVFLKKGLCLHPKHSLVNNIGHDGTGTHCTNMSAFEVIVSKDNITYFPDSILENKNAIDALIKYFLSSQTVKPSIRVRLLRKLQRLL